MLTKFILLHLDNDVFPFELDVFFFVLVLVKGVPVLLPFSSRPNGRAEERLRQCSTCRILVSHVAAANHIFLPSCRHQNGHRKPLSLPENPTG